MTSSAGLPLYIAKRFHRMTTSRFDGENADLEPIHGEFEQVFHARGDHW
jgi:hypothetical protein